MSDQQLREAFEKVGAALQEYFQALGAEISAALQGPPKPPTTGPAPRRSKNPKHH